MVISLTGARPCELNGISIDGRRIHISGAKLSHNGLRGASRTLEADGDVCNILRNALAAFKCQPRSMDSIRVALHQVATELFGRRKVPSMYTLRHQFGSNLKASGMSAIEMAYVMGHRLPIRLAAMAIKDLDVQKRLRLSLQAMLTFQR